MCLSHATKFQRNREIVVPTRYRNKMEEAISVLCHYRAKCGVNGNVSLEELV